MSRIDSASHRDSMNSLQPPAQAVELLAEKPWACAQGYFPAVVDALAIAIFLTFLEPLNRLELSEQAQGFF